ncbi:hypothetical protein RYX41_08245 [Lactiplantibacillus plantarum]|nr:hypothetical protein [Lactiplantibacillus plantarum]
MNKNDEIKMMIEHPEYIIHAEKIGIEKRIKQKKLDAGEVKTAMIDTAKSQGKGLVSDILNGKWEILSLMWLKLEIILKLDLMI